METTPKLFNSNKVTYTNVRVIDIYDGDTITVAIQLFPDKLKQETICQKKVRLMHIDCPEMKSKNCINRQLAVKARDRLYNLITGLTDIQLKRSKMCEKLSEKAYLVTIKIYGEDMYGRLLADVYAYNNTSAKSFSHVLLDEKLAYRYDGATKLTEGEIEEQLG
jgi:endonuclease YncB( thermonuclease family)